MKKILAIVAAFTIVGFNGFMLLEGATTYAAYDQGPSTSSPLTCEWDVNLTVDPQIAIDCSTSSVSLAPNILGMTGGSATGNHACTVYTNDKSGWTLKLNSDGPLDNTADDTGDVDAFADSNPDVAVCTGNAACFGFRTNTAYLDFSGGEVTINSGDDDNADAGGTLTTMTFRATVGNAKNQESGNYTTHITATAAML